MTGAALAVLLPAVVGALACRAAWPTAPRSAAAFVLQGSIGLGLGLGAASVAYFVALLTGGSPGGWYAWVEGTGFALGGAALLTVLRRRPPAPAPPPGEPDRPAVVRLAAAALAVAAASFLLAFVVYNGMVPHGINDAVMFWNLRARFLYRGGDHWRDGFDPAFTAPDYPLLLPATVARTWTYAGGETLAGPALVALAFAAATVGTLVSVLTLARGRVQGLLAGVVLLGTTYFFETTAMLVVDVPIGLYYLGCGALLVLADRGGGRGLWVPAGALAGFAAWAKNDGQLFVAAILAVRFGRAALGGDWRGGRRELGAVGAGLAAALGGLVLFKFGVAPASDFVTGQGGGATVARLTDPGRYVLIAEFFVEGLLGIGPGLVVLLAGYAALVGRAPADRRAGAGWVAVLAGVMLVGYAAVYLVTPHDLRWRLDTSFDRLRIQLWPLALLAFFLWVATPAESFGAPPPSAAPLPPPPPVPVPVAKSTGGGLPEFRPCTGSRD